MFSPVILVYVVSHNGGFDLGFRGPSTCYSHRPLLPVIHRLGFSLSHNPSLPLWLIPIILLMDRGIPVVLLPLPVCSFDVCFDFNLFKQIEL